MALKIPGLNSEGRLLRFLWTAAKGNHFVIIVTMLLQMALGLLPAAITYYIQNLFTDTDATLQGILNTHNLLLLCGVILAMILLKESIAVAQSYAMVNIKRSIESWYIATLATYDYATVHDRMDNRNIMAITRESEMVTNLLPDIYRAFFGSPITIMAFIALLIVVSPTLTGIVTLLLAVVVICSLLLRRVTKATSRRLYDRYSDMHVSFSEWLRGYKVFMLNGASDYMRRRLDSVVIDTASLAKKLTRIQAGQSIAVELLTYSIVIVFVIVLQHTSTFSARSAIPALISFPAAILFIRNEAIKITKCYSKLAKTESAARRLLHDIHHPVKPHEAKSWTAPIRSITFRNVHFAYPESRTSILRGANMTIPGPGFYVMAGPSGIGKSTCLDLLMGLRPPCSGLVEYNGEDISAYSADSLLEHISYVEQEPFIFEGSIIDNIAFGRSVDRTRVLQLCHNLRLDHIVATESDLDKPLAVDGKDLSVGERQRIAFVRALIKDPDVIILDETTSNVDSGARDIMVEQMVRNGQSKIVICVSHDQYVIEHADVTIKLYDGLIQLTQN